MSQHIGAESLQNPKGDQEPEKSCFTVHSSRLEKSFEITEPNLPPKATLSPGAASTWFLNPSSDEDSTTASGSLCQAGSPLPREINIRGPV